MSTKQKQEIVVFLTPHITSGEANFGELDKLKKEEKLLNILKDSAQIEEEKRQRKNKNNPEQKNISEEQNDPVLSQQSEALHRIEAQKTAFESASFLNNDRSNYFLNVKRRILGQIHKNFPDLKLEGESSVTFTLDADGKLLDEPKIISEDNRMVGDAVVEGVRLASPFEKFPATFDTQEETFTLSVRFEP